MKKSFFMIVAIVFLATLTPSFGQSETKPDEDTKQGKKISYSFINEYGIYFGSAGDYYRNGSSGFTGIFVNGICFNKTQDLIGIGIGYEGDNRYGYGMPLFVNYRHYFSCNKKLKPLINIGFGAKLYITKSYKYGIVYPGCLISPVIDVVPGMYATFVGGFKVKAFSFTSGAFVKSGGDDFFAGLEVKVGFTF